MADEWTSYFANINGQVVSILVNLGVYEAAPDPQRPWLLWAAIRHRRATEEGLPDQEEMEALSQIEDGIIQLVEQRTGATMAGRIMGAGRNVLYFYAAGAEGFEEAVGEAQAEDLGYVCECGAGEDPEWSHYLNVLYPDAVAMQQAHNMQVVMELEKHGDCLDKPRPVSHWLYFPTSEARSQFAAEAARNGFTVTDQADSAKHSPESPFGITVERTDAVQLDAITAVTMELCRLAEQYGGDYDGWETSLVRDDES
jgi:uncharacterized protein (TIGR01619 family)